MLVITVMYKSGKSLTSHSLPYLKHYVILTRSKGLEHKSMDNQCIEQAVKALYIHRYISS